MALHLRFAVIAACVAVAMPLSDDCPRCDRYPKCTGLEGDCCPTPAGLALECCPSGFQSQQCFPTSCSSDDAKLEKWTFIRYLVMGSITLYKVYSLGKRAGENDSVRPFRDHPILTRQIREAPNIVKKLFWSVGMFIQTEGVGVAIYFGVSAMMDNATIFFISNWGVCKYAVTVALYTTALVTFLPNVFLALKFQPKYYEEGGRRSKACFIIGMVLVTLCAFYARLRWVTWAGWHEDLSRLFEDHEQYRVWIAICTPPLVDAIQTLVLIEASEDKNKEIQNLRDYIVKLKKRSPPKPLVMPLKGGGSS